jgi:cob(I)alamin adenosyltransferase
MNIHTTTLTGEKISKNDALIHLEGTLDELNAHLGLVKAGILEANRDLGDGGVGDYGEFIESIQTVLMKLMAHVSSLADEKFFITESEISILDKKIKDLRQFIPNDFTIPGKSAFEAQIHIARTVARRAERCFVAAITAIPALAAPKLNPQAGDYLNKLSNYMFALACKEASKAQTKINII